MMISFSWTNGSVRVGFLKDNVHVKANGTKTIASLFDCDRGRREIRSETLRRRCLAIHKIILGYIQSRRWRLHILSTQCSTLDVFLHGARSNSHDQVSNPFMNAVVRKCNETGACSNIYNRSICSNCKGMPPTTRLPMGNQITSPALAYRKR